MIEVFKTNVSDTNMARQILNSIHETFREYSANFDLQDCDRILRIKTENHSVDIVSVVSIVRSKGFLAEVLCDVHETPLEAILKESL